MGGSIFPQHSAAGHCLVQKLQQLGHGRSESLPKPSPRFAGGISV